MNEIEVPSTPTERQQAYLRHLAARAHEAGMPHLHIASFTRAQASEWIDYLRLVVTAEERVRETLERAKREAKQVSAPYLVTPPRDELPASYRPPWQELPSANDHEHLIGSVRREDGVEESVCVLCGVSA
jgi:hypothetical protein